jgi:DNA topoisomerase-1
VLLTRYGPAATASERTRTVNRALRAAAHALRNTLSVCRKSYVHPGVTEAYMADALPARRLKERSAGLSVAESRTLVLLRKLRAPAARPKARPRVRRPPQETNVQHAA